MQGDRKQLRLFSRATGPLSTLLSCTWQRYMAVYGIKESNLPPQEILGKYIITKNSCDFLVMDGY